MPFVSYIMQYFKNDFVLSTDKKFDVVRIVLPMVVKFVKSIADMRIFKYFGDLSKSYKKDALTEVAFMEAEV